MYQWLKDVWKWLFWKGFRKEIEIEGKVNKIKRRVSRNSHKAFYKAWIEQNNKEYAIFFWKSDLRWKWKIVKSLTENNEVKLKAKNVNGFYKVKKIEKIN